MSDLLFGFSFATSSMPVNFPGGDWVFLDERFATPPPRSRWRLRAGPTRRWRVAELSFHAVCGSAPVAGVFLYAPLDPVVGNTEESSVGALRDGNRATIWSSSCWQCADGEAWLGVALDEAAVGNGVQCVRLLQDRADSAEPPALALQVLDGAWTSVATWPSVAVAGRCHDTDSYMIVRRVPWYL